MKLNELFVPMRDLEVPTHGDLDLLRIILWPCWALLLDLRCSNDAFGARVLLVPVSSKMVAET